MLCGSKFSEIIEYFIYILLSIDVDHVSIAVYIVVDLLSSANVSKFTYLLVLD